MPLDFAWLGQGLAIDLANTYVPTQQADLLAQWPEPRKRDVPLAQLRELRALVTEVLSAAAEGRALPRRAVAALNQVSANAPLHTTLERGKLVRHDPLPGAIARSAFEAAADPDRLARCGAPGCGMFFRAARTRQVWCSASCGNRARVARHYARTRTASPA